MKNGTTLHVEAAVRERYSKAIAVREQALCCAVQYNTEYLKAIPQEIIERDYGCGDPSRHVRPGEVVLDLGSGTGKICFIAAQVVGATGRVIGVDMNDDMLAMARGAAPVVADRIGYANVEFKKGKIQDLKLDCDRVDAWLHAHPIADEPTLRAYESFADQLKQHEPMIAECSVDVVVSNCVLNLVDERHKKELFAEIFRVLKRGGRAVISDIVSDEIVPTHLKEDPHLWSGCIAGAFQESAFLKAFEEAGFYGITLAARDPQPWRTIEGIEFRSVTVIAYKGKEGTCFEHNEALMYKGPFKSVTDDDGHRFPRGERVAVCRKTFDIYSREPYRDSFEAIAPLNAIDPADAQPFPCTGGTRLRDPRETKGEDYHPTTEASGGSCGPECC